MAKVYYEKQVRKKNLTKLPVIPPGMSGVISLKKRHRICSLYVTIIPPSTLASKILHSAYRENTAANLFVGRSCQNIPYFCLIVFFQFY